ncbi:MAG: hypothetical protein ACLFRV_12000 [Acidimicrobiales bacterium]
MTVAEGAVAGLVAGWACFVTGHWLVLVRLPVLDLAAMGRRYLDAPVAGWLFGLVHHLVNSTLLGALYAAAIIWWREDGEPLSLPVGTAVGVAFGVVVWAVVAMSMVLPGTGRGWFGSKLDNRKPLAGNLLVHLVFGGLVGAIAR